MYCINCGVKLCDSQTKCPLCNTVVWHPEFNPDAEKLLFPKNKMPPSSSGTKALGGAVIIMFLIPLLVCFLADLMLDGTIEWFGYVAGALFVGYIMFALPLWFKKPNPVIFVPCSFAATALYLLYINFATGGNWFLSFAFPVSLGICLITSTVVTLTHYLKKGRLYIFGGAFASLGTFMLLVEYLLSITFNIKFAGWSFYPLVVLVLFGCLLIYFAINADARETIRRKLFF